MTQVLVDEQANRRLLRDGFVVIPFLEPARAAALRARSADEFPHLTAENGPGFYCDMDIDDLDRRLRASAFIRRELDDAAGALFANHEPFLRNFLQKRPGDHSTVPYHRDWAYVDERAGHRTYTLWLALDDVDSDNGQMRVLRNSHTIDHMLRGTNLAASWLDHSFVLDSVALTVPVPAGHAIIFDNSLTHGSHPNLSDARRLAIGMAFHNVDHDLVHYRRIDETRAARYRVTPTFFEQCNPRALHTEPPALPIDAIVSIESTDYTPEELAEVLGRSPLAKLDRARRVVTRTRYNLRPSTLRRRGTAWLAHRRDLANAAVRRAVNERLQGPRSTVERTTRSLRSTRTRAKDRIARSRATLREIPSTARRSFESLPSKAAIGVLAANEAVVTKFGPQSPAIWDHHQFEWSDAIERAWPEIRAEVDALLMGRTEIPHIQDVAGGIPQGNVGPWRTFVMMHQGRWIDWNCERCPETTRLVRSIPGLTMAGFSVLEPGTHITEHRGPNKGALRYQLGVIVPGVEGACRIRVGTDMIHWHEGEGVMFDFTVPHEAWNDSSEIRVLLMLEVVTPLPWYLSPTNRLAQRAMGWFPTTRDITNRLRRLEPTLVRPEPPVEVEV